jgi:hypothetical protein
LVCRLKEETLRIDPYGWGPTRDGLQLALVTPAIPDGNPKGISIGAVVRNASSDAIEIGLTGGLDFIKVRLTGESDFGPPRGLPSVIPEDLPGWTTLLPGETLAEFKRFKWADFDPMLEFDTCEAQVWAVCYRDRERYGRGVAPPTVTELDSNILRLSRPSVQRK